MKTFIAILRGINVSGHRLIKMEALKKLCIDNGFENVQTYIQSGNIVFDHPDGKDLETVLTRAIKNNFGHDVPVTVLSATEWKKILDNNPYVNDKTKDPASLYVTVLSGKPDKSPLDKIKTGLYGNDAFICKGNIIYLYCPGGYGKTKLTNDFFESKLKLGATTRNWKTMNVLLKMTSKK
jgi:uncharacterized protein (DUF1697 family)